MANTDITRSRYVTSWGVCVSASIDIDIKWRNIYVYHWLGLAGIDIDIRWRNIYVYHWLGLSKLQVPGARLRKPPERPAHSETPALRHIEGWHAGTACPAPRARVDRAR